MQGCRMWRAVDTGAGPLLPPSQPRPLLPTAVHRLCGLSRKGTLSAPASPRRALQNPGHAPARALGTPRCTQEKGFSIRPWATQDGTCPLGGAALPWRLRGHAGRAPRPEDAAPAQPRLALVFREPGPSPGEGTPRVRSPFLVSAPTFRLPGTLGTAQHRPSPPSRPTCPLLVWVKSSRQLPERSGAAASREGSAALSLPSLIEARNRGGWSPFPLERPRPPAAPSEELPQSARFFPIFSGGYAALARGWGGTLAARESESVPCEARVCRRGQPV